MNQPADTNGARARVAAGMTVMHRGFGQGSVLLVDGATAIVRFAHGIEQVLSAELTELASVSDAMPEVTLASSLEVGLKAQAAAIASVNDAWGVFTRSRISLLPHQLWVCHRALRDWPIRLLIADDVGMGKTIEAGLVLWPLLASRKVQRVLILAPAKLVEQWQQRLKSMFDIRAAIYHPEVDTQRADFWGIHQIVVASLPTLRADNKGRHERLLEAPAWDMVIVDEAHHLNVDDSAKRTLGFDLLDKLQLAGKVESCVLFSGTPHRGKSYGFWSLMSLVDRDVFGPKRDEAAMLAALPRYLIRNAKQKATDMHGERLFKPVEQHPETFRYTPAEEAFYKLMSEFIMEGRAYASSLNRSEGGQVMLVLIALQKLASSSIAAVLAALDTRRKRLRQEAIRSRSELDLESETDDDDIRKALDAWMRDDRRARLQLMEDEGRYLDDLIEAGQQVTEETRVRKVIEVIRERFNGEPVLLFTEYKQTQSLIVSALMAGFGQGSVGFLNGDDRLDGVLLPDGRRTPLPSRRDDTCDAFNAGRIRFLVSTEAGGEGIDLQHRCSALIHVDLPWNPMRLHQRVGRLNRYGQKRTVSVVSLRNPDTVESMIWEKLESKLASIMRAVGSAMDEPEDLLQLVLGMSGERLFEQLFAGASELPRERLDTWFDEVTGTLGGVSAIQTVRDLVGRAAGFDLSALKEVPPVDLPDLLPFVQSSLVHNRRRPKVDDLSLSFKTPEEWVTSHAIRRHYDNLLFDRKAPANIGDLMGVGHPLMEKVLQAASRLHGVICMAEGLETPLRVIAVSSKVTGRAGLSGRLVFGVTGTPGSFRLCKDWEVLCTLNTCALKPEPAVVPNGWTEAARGWLSQASAAMPSLFASEELLFDSLHIDEIAMFWTSL
ncbi:helicase SNF2 [Caballeronia megalochromosomata]|jgi:ERCC4-related helicase|nr:helicase SNF2 [Caballeronia megalochromosomata]